MWKTLPVYVALGLALAMSSCVPSLHPLYTGDDVVFEPALLGTWSEQKGDDTWTFSRSGEKAYKLVCVHEPPAKGELVVHLVKVGDRLFLDLFPAELKVEASDLYMLHLLPVHTFMQVKRITPTLEMTIMDASWLEKLLAKEPDALPHQWADHRLVLTAKPEELQAFLLKHAASEDAWEDFSRMTKKPR